MIAAVETLVRLAPEVETDLAEVSEIIHETSSRELHWVEAQVTRNPSTWQAVDSQPEQESRLDASVTPETGWMAEARRLAPRRIGRGPIAAVMTLQAKASTLLPYLWAMAEESGDEFYDVTSLAEYWADGNRSIAAITDLISLETGRPADDLPLRYFKLLAQASLVDLDESG
jgi:hypothetical protein